jgi:hypothetical protein
MTLNVCTITSIAYATEDTGADAPCVFVWTDGRTETHPKSWTGFFRGVVGGRNAAGEDTEWQDGCGMNAGQSVVAAFGGSIGAYVPPPPPVEDPAP